MTLRIERDRVVVGRLWPRELFFEELQSVCAAADRVVLETTTGRRFRVRSADADAPAAATLLGEIIEGVEGAVSRTRTVADVAREIARRIALRGFFAPSLASYLLRAGAALGASDLHLEPGGSGMTVSLRIDGWLHPAGEIPACDAARLTGRLKVLAGVHLHIVDAHQHGRVKVGDTEGDARITFVPTVTGAAITIRFFDQRKGRCTLPDLGLLPVEAEAIATALAAPEGLVVIAGPSGSGKTTTLYAALRHVLATRGGAARAITVEDPVEHRIEGVVQLEAHGERMADLIRQALRLDAQVLCVGEVRDPASAALMVEAAHTGHLVLATLHAPSAERVAARLCDLGVDPEKLRASLRGVIAQRLVRLRCACPKGAVASGCGCGGTGYLGRAAVAEVLGATPSLAEALRARVAAGRTDDAESRRITG